MRSIETIGILGLFMVGCGADAGGPASEPAHAELQGELASVTEKLGEATCGTIAADDSFDYTSGRIGAGTTDGNYGHPECTNGYVVDVTNVPAGGTIYAGSLLPRWPDPFTCLLDWGYGSLWKQSGTGYVKLSELSTLGVWGGIGGPCSAEVTLKAPAAGNYRVVASAGVLFGAIKGPVSITHP
jgi:hypothetical protein